MFTDIEPSADFNKQLISFINNKDENAFIDSIESGKNLHLCANYLTLGSFAYFPMPNAALSLLTKLSNTQAVNEDFYKLIFGLSGHFKKTEDLVNWMVNHLTVEQVNNYLIYLSESKLCHAHLIQILLSFDEHWDWSKKGQTMLESLYQSSANGWCLGTIAFLESREVRVNPDFNINLKWHSRVSPEHQLKYLEFLPDLLANCLRSKDRLSSDVYLLRHHHHLMTACAYAILGVVIEEIPLRITAHCLLEILPTELGDSVELTDKQAVISTSSPVFESIKNLLNADHIKQYDGFQVEHERKGHLIVQRQLQKMISRKNQGGSVQTSRLGLIERMNEEFKPCETKPSKVKLK